MSDTSDDTVAGVTEDVEQEEQELDEEQKKAQEEAQARMSKAMEVARELISNVDEAKGYAKVAVAGHQLQNYAVIQLGNILSQLRDQGRLKKCEELSHREIMVAVIETIRTAVTGSYTLEQTKQLLNSEVSIVLDRDIAQMKKQEEAQREIEAKIGLPLPFKRFHTQEVKGNLHKGQVVLFVGGKEAVDYAINKTAEFCGARNVRTVRFTRGGAQAGSSAVQAAPESWWGGSLADAGKSREVFSAGALGPGPALIVDDIIALEYENDEHTGTVTDDVIRSILKKLKRAARRAKKGVVAGLYRDGANASAYRDGNGRVIPGLVELSELDGEQVLCINGVPEIEEEQENGDGGHEPGEGGTPAGGPDQGAPDGDEGTDDSGAVSDV